MIQNIENNVYVIKDNDGKELLSIILHPDDFPFKNQITITTQKERYTGPIDLITFSK